MPRPIEANYTPPGRMLELLARHCHTGGLCRCKGSAFATYRTYQQVQSVHLCITAACLLPLRIVSKRYEYPAQGRGTSSAGARGPTLRCPRWPGRSAPPRASPMPGHVRRLGLPAPPGAVTWPVAGRLCRQAALLRPSQTKANKPQSHVAQRTATHCNADEYY